MTVQQQVAGVVSQQGVLEELQRLEAQRRRLERRSEQLRRRAVEVGVSQARVARVLDVRQPSVSRQLARPVDPAAEQVAEAIDAFVLGEIDLDELSQVIVDRGGVEAHPVVARAVLRDAVPASIMTQATTRPTGAGLEEQLAGMDPSTRLDVVHQHVLAAVDVLAARQDQSRFDLIRAERHLNPDDSSAALELLRRCRQVTGA